MPSATTWFVEQRAENLAIVLLTRFPVSICKGVNGGRAIDLRVTLDPDKPSVHEFGVEIIGTMHIRDVVDERHRVLPQGIQRSQRILEDCPFPVALMVFDVKTDKGLFGWLLAPVINGSQSGLTRADPVFVEAATDDVIARALGQVRQWYRSKPWRIR